MLPQYHARFSNYVAGYFPEDFHVDVAFADHDEGILLIRIATPGGVLASYETTAVQALDVIAMGDIASMLKTRVGYTQSC
jgi:hypothetical protein